MVQLVTPVEVTTEQLLDVHTEEYISQLHSSSTKVIEASLSASQGNVCMVYPGPPDTGLSLLQEHDTILWL